MRLMGERSGNSLKSSRRQTTSLNWSRAVIRMLQFFGWLTLLGAFLGSLGFTWFFGTVGVASAEGIHREVNLIGIAAACGILFVGILVTLFLFVVCAAATALIDLREQRREENEAMMRVRPGELALIPGGRENEPERNVMNIKGSVPNDFAHGT